TIVGVFNVGTQEIPHQGETRRVVCLVLVFELVETRPDGRPFVLAQRYTWSLHEKAAFNKVATAVTGRKFVEGDILNVLDLLKRPVMVQVSSQGSDGKTYHRVEGVGAFPKGFGAPTPTHKPIAWTVLDGKPLPRGLEWIPWVYGKSLATMAAESDEA